MIEYEHPDKVVMFPFRHPDRCGGMVDEADSMRIEKEKPEGVAVKDGEIRIRDLLTEEDIEALEDVGDER